MWTRRVGIIARARRAWLAHDPHTGVQTYYYAKWRNDLVNLIGQDC
jgi:hypothetical protein